MNVTEKPEHIGDGVYIWSDGYHIWLGTNYQDGQFENRIALEDTVANALVKCIFDTFDWVKDARTKE